MARNVRANTINAEWVDSNYRIRIKLGSPTGGVTYRVRLFYNYSGITGFTGNDGCGLYAILAKGQYARYDDWDSTFRPPRADSVPLGFNTEIVAGFDDYEVDLTLDGRASSGVVDLRNSLTGSSVGTTASAGTVISTKDTQVLVEELDHTVNVVSVTTDGGVVTAVTNGPHGFSDGDAVSIYGIPGLSDDTSNHRMGVDGERYMGTFRISVEPDYPNRFTYVTVHYSDSIKSYNNLTHCTASKWVSSVMEIDGCSAEAGDDDLLIRKTGIGARFRTGDYVMLVDDDGSPILDVCAMVKLVMADSILLDCPPDAASGDGFGLRYCGSAPSAAVPVNWPTYALTVLENSTSYDHTVNTVKIVPVRDSMFSSSGTRNFGRTGELELSTGSIAVFEFVAPLALATVDSGANLNLYVTGMTDSVGSIVLYQMGSTGWEYSMTLDAIRDMVTDISVSSAKVVDKALSGGPNQYVSFHVPGNVVQNWIMKGNRYPMDIAAVYVGTGSATVYSAETEYPPYMVVTGGETAVEDPPVFSILPQVAHAAPGSVVRFTAQGGAEIDDAIFSHTFWFIGKRGERTETEAFIVTGSAKYIDVIVPDALNGDYSVELRGSRPDGTSVVLTDECSFYVDGNPQMRVIKLADKLAPGLKNDGKVGTRGIYAKGFAFDNFAEITDGNALLQNVYSILLTRRGERLFNPQFGTTLEDRIFDLIMDGDETSILSECVSALKKYEPRVTVSNPDSFVNVDDSGNGMIITLGLVMPSGVKQTIRLPFKSRGNRWHA